MFVASFTGLTDSRAEPLRSGSDQGDVSRDANHRLVRADNELNVGELLAVEQFAQVIVQCALWVARKLEAHHFTASHVVVHGPAENVPARSIDFD